MNANFYQKCQPNFSADKDFLIDVVRGTTYTFANLDDITSNMASWLKLEGLEIGQRVIVQVEKSPQNLFWYFACLRAGLVYLPLNTAYQPAELEYFVGNAEPSLIICDPNNKELFSKLAECRVCTLDSEGNFSSSIPTADSFQNQQVSEDDIAVILYTSGTTGQPKGAMITHGNLAANTESLSLAWQWKSSDVLLHALPIFHIHGLFVASHLPIMNGSTIRFLDKFSPSAVIKQLPSSSVYMGVPTNYTRLLQDPEFSKSACLNMRLFTSGSAPLLSQTFKQMKDRTGHEIVERYGMTETGMNTSNPIDGPRKPGTVGPALAGVETKIVDNQELLLKSGEPGGLLVRGKNVFRGYWQMPEKTAEEFTQDGFFRTGDIASIDDDGYVSIVGRSKDLVITGGLNVYPKEIESVIDKIAGVAESAVIGIHDDDFGEAVTAVIVRADKSLTKDAIHEELKNLASFKRPKHLHFVETLPRNTMGKVQKNLLRQQYGQPVKQ